MPPTRSTQNFRRLQEAQQTRAVTPTGQEQATFTNLFEIDSKSREARQGSCSEQLIDASVRQPLFELGNMTLQLLDRVLLMNVPHVTLWASEGVEEAVDKRVRRNFGIESSTKAISF